MHYLALLQLTLAPFTNILLARHALLSNKCSAVEGVRSEELCMTKPAYVYVRRRLISIVTLIKVHLKPVLIHNPAASTLIEFRTRVG